MNDFDFEHCSHCGSAAIAKVGSEDWKVSRQEIREHYHCSTCKKTWTAIFKLERVKK